MTRQVIKAGTIKRLHVNRQIVARNRKTNGSAPALTVQTSKGSFVARRVEIHGESVLVQSKKPLKCGARVWVETIAEVVLIL